MSDTIAFWHIYATEAIAVNEHLMPIARVLFEKPFSARLYAQEQNALIREARLDSGMLPLTKDFPFFYEEEICVALRMIVEDRKGSWPLTKPDKGFEWVVRECPGMDEDFGVWQIVQNRIEG